MDDLATRDTTFSPAPLTEAKIELLIERSLSMIGEFIEPERLGHRYSSPLTVGQTLSLLNEVAANRRRLDREAHGHSGAIRSITDAVVIAEETRAALKEALGMLSRLIEADAMEASDVNTARDLVRTTVHLVT